MSALGTDCSHAPGNRNHDPARDFVLQIEDISEFTIIALSPDMVCGLRVDELRVDPHAIACFAHATFDYVANPELRADLPKADTSILKFEGRAACRDLDFMESGEFNNDVSRDAIGKVFLLSITTHIREGQNNNKRLA